MTIVFSLMEMAVTRCTPTEAHHPRVNQIQQDAGFKRKFKLACSDRLGAQAPSVGPKEEKKIYSGEL